MKGSESKMNVEFNEEFYCKVEAKSILTLQSKWMDITVELYRKGLKLNYEVLIKEFNGSVREPFILKKRYQKKIDKLINRKVAEAKFYMNQYIQNREIRDKINKS